MCVPCVPVQSIVDTLDLAYYTLFAAVEPAGKRTLLALDVAGSMSFGEVAGGLDRDGCQ